MKIKIEINDVEVLEVYTRTDGRRDWGRTTTWLYPGEIVCQIGGDSADNPTGDCGVL
jgi:hypothetical protein